MNANSSPAAANSQDMTSHKPAENCMRHEPQSRRFVNALGDGRVILKLQSACDAIDRAHLVWRDGRSEREHHPFETPAWVRDAVFYQMFPERFCNGNATNDPPNTEPWGTPPAIRNF